MRLLDRLRPPSRTSARYGVEATYGGFGLEMYETWSPATPWQNVEAAGNFSNYVQAGYQANGIVFAVILSRLLLFSEATFKWRRFNKGRPGDLYGTQELEVLESPWPGGTTGDLLAKMEQHVSLAGNAYVLRPLRYRGTLKDYLRVLRPDWVDIIIGSKVDPVEPALQWDSEVVGYIYWPGGTRSSQTPFETFLPSEMAHYAPIPDPAAHVRGMSWLTPVVREVNSDTSMTTHKGRFFENAATPNLLVKVEQSLTQSQRDRIEQVLHSRHEGSENAYRTMLLENGADATVVGSTFEQMSFTNVQAAGENRIAAAAGVPGIVVGLKEGLQAATYSNYRQALSRFRDLTMRPLWRNAAASLAPIIDPPPFVGSRSQLWYDDRDIAALREDAADEANIQKTRSEAIKTLIDAGYKADSVVAAVTNDDFTLLEASAPAKLAPTPGLVGGGQSDGSGGDGGQAAPSGDGQQPAAAAAGQPSSFRGSRAAELDGLLQAMMAVSNGRYS